MDTSEPKDSNLRVVDVAKLKEMIDNGVYSTKSPSGLTRGMTLIEVLNKVKGYIDECIL